MKAIRFLRRFYIGSVTEMPNKRDSYEEQRMKEYVSWICIDISLLFWYNC